MAVDLRLLCWTVTRKWHSTKPLIIMTQWSMPTSNGWMGRKGIFFETLCVRDLRVFAQALDGNVYHYRDKTGLECDTVVHLRNGNYGLIEIKIGGDRLIE